MKTLTEKIANLTRWISTPLAISILGLTGTAAQAETWGYIDSPTAFSDDLMRERYWSQVPVYQQNDLNRADVILVDTSDAAYSQQSKQLIKAAYDQGKIIVFDSTDFRGNESEVTGLISDIAGIGIYQDIVVLRKGENNQPVMVNAPYADFWSKEKNVTETISKLESLIRSHQYDYLQEESNRRSRRTKRYADSFSSNPSAPPESTLLTIEVNEPIQCTGFKGMYYGYWALRLDESEAQIQKNRCENGYFSMVYIVDVDNALSNPNNDKRVKIMHLPIKAPGGAYNPVGTGWKFTDRLSIETTPENSEHWAGQLLGPIATSYESTIRPTGSTQYNVSLVQTYPSNTGRELTIGSMKIKEKETGWEAGGSVEFGASKKDGASGKVGLNGSYHEIERVTERDWLLYKSLVYPETNFSGNNEARWRWDLTNKDSNARLRDKLAIRTNGVVWKSDFYTPESYANFNPAFAAVYNVRQGSADKLDFELLNAADIDIYAGVFSCSSPNSFFAIFVGNGCHPTHSSMSVRAGSVKTSSTPRVEVRKNISVNLGHSIFNKIDVHRLRSATYQNNGSGSCLTYHQGRDWFETYYSDGRFKSWEREEAGVKMQDCAQEGSSVALNQEFYFDEGLYKLNADPSLCLKVDAYNGGKVSVGTCENTDYFKWDLEQMGNHWKIKTKNPSWTVNGRPMAINRDGGVSASATGGSDNRWIRYIPSEGAVYSYVNSRDRTPRSTGRFWVEPARPSW